MFATDRMAGVKRAFSGLPYIVHPIEVMKRLGDMGVKTEMILVAAVLHDIIEDTDTRYTELEEQFGLDVTTLVKQLTQDPGEPKEDYLASFRVAPPDALLIKVVDRWCNTNDFWHSGKKAKAAKYALAGKSIVEGIYNLRDELPNHFNPHTVGCMLDLASDLVLIATGKSPTGHRTHA